MLGLGQQTHLESWVSNSNCSFYKIFFGSTKIWWQGSFWREEEKNIHPSPNEPTQKAFSWQKAGAKVASPRTSPLKCSHVFFFRNFPGELVGGVVCLFVCFFLGYFLGSTSWSFIHLRFSNQSGANGWRCCLTSEGDQVTNEVMKSPVQLFIGLVIYCYTPEIERIDTKKWYAFGKTYSFKIFGSYFGSLSQISAGYCFFER